MSVRAAISAGVTTYKDGALYPISKDVDWSAFEYRLLRYTHSKHYYINTAYGALQAYATQFLEDKDYYQHTRPIYNPVWRLVEGYVANIWKGNLDFERLEGGAIPLVGLDDPLRDAIRQLYIWSVWQTKKSLAVRRGAMLGDLVLKVVDDRDRRKVRIEVLTPEIVQEVTRDPAGNVKSITFAYMRDMGGESKLYQETIDQDSFKTYLEGEPYAYPENTVNGVAVPAWPNPYGFVPVVLSPHVDLGFGWGANAFMPAWPKIDELNDAASKTNDLIRKSLNPVYAFFGVAAKSQVVFDAEADERNSVPALYIPNPDASAVPLVPSVDLTAALSNIDHMLEELERDLPELALARLREHGELTAPGVRAGFADAIARYQEARALYDSAIVRALQMGISIGGYNNYDNLERFGLEDYQRGNLEFSAKDRPVIEDAITLDRKIELLIQTGAPTAYIWQLLGMSEEEATQANAEKESLDRVLAGEFGAALVSGAANPLLAAGGNGSEALPQNIESGQGLNGAQIDAALSILGGVQLGTTPASVAIELLIALGIDEARARRMVEATANNRASVPMSEL